ncbi:MAG TPA: EamA family transporter [Rhabdaerophilum sp.]|nr:EamA family transporter [Rhabdaerophilum sp.]
MIVLSIGAIGLMLMMIRRGAVSRVAALIYLIPPTAAVQAWLMFGEMLTPVQIACMIITAFGVYLATRP